MSRFYIEQQLEDVWAGKLDMYDWQSGMYTPPLQYLRNNHLPTMTAAAKLPPAGRFATTKDLDGQPGRPGAPYEQEAPVPLVHPMVAAAGLLAAFYLFLPQAV